MVLVGVLEAILPSTDQRRVGAGAASILAPTFVWMLVGATKKDGQGGRGCYIPGIVSFIDQDMGAGPLQGPGGRRGRCRRCSGRREHGARVRGGRVGSKGDDPMAGGEVRGRTLMGLLAAAMVVLMAFAIPMQGPLVRSAAAASTVFIVSSCSLAGTIGNRRWRPIRAPIMSI